VSSLSADLKAKQEEFSRHQEQQDNEIAQLSAALASREEAFSQLIQQFEAARDEAERFKQEKKELRGAWERERLNDRNQLEKEKTEKDGLASKLTAAKKEAHDAKVELHGLRGKCDSAERQLAQQIQAAELLREELRRVSEASVAATERLKFLEDQVGVQEALKTSRLGFVTEVWGLHKNIKEVRSQMQSQGKDKGFVARNSPRQTTNASAAVSSETPVTHSIMQACKRSTMLIAKYLTDDEKLHLGAPLAHYEGGHDSPQPLDWSGNCDVAPVSVDDGELPSTSEHFKLAKQLEAQEKRHRNTSVSDLLGSRKHIMLQQQKRSPRLSGSSTASS
jgi:hypothetical protein